MRSRSLALECTRPDPLWDSLRSDAEDAARREPVLAGTIHAMVLGQSTLEGSIAGRIAALVASRESPAHLVISAFEEALSDDPSIGVAFRTDMSAFVDRDPATTRLIQVLLYLKGFHALELHRISHWLWTRGRFDLALELQARASEVLQADIHPAAQLGSGLFLDHSTGIVIGETAIVEDGVSILQGVTLGGTGTTGGRRHPHIRCGVLIGSGAKVLGPIEVGERARIGAGSLVVDDVPAGATVAGVPARIVGHGTLLAPSETMDQDFLRLSA